MAAHEKGYRKTNACRVPGKCKHEGFVVDGKKSYCVQWGRWTNCREAGRCLLVDDDKEE